MIQIFHKCWMVGSEIEHKLEAHNYWILLQICIECSFNSHYNRKIYSVLVDSLSILSNTSIKWIMFFIVSLRWQNKRNEGEWWKPPERSRVRAVFVMLSIKEQASISKLDYCHSYRGTVKSFEKLMVYFKA